MSGIDGHRNYKNIYIHLHTQTHTHTDTLTQFVDHRCPCYCTQPKDARHLHQPQSHGSKRFLCTIGHITLHYKQADRHRVKRERYTLHNSIILYCGGGGQEGKQTGGDRVPLCRSHSLTWDTLARSSRHPSTPPPRGDSDDRYTCRDTEA